MKTVIKSLLVLSMYLGINTAKAQLNWRIQGSSDSKEQIKLGDKKTGGRYLLLNTTVGENRRAIPLKYGDKKPGINLIWGAHKEKISETNFVNILRKPGASGPLKTGEPIALRFEGGGFLGYGEQTFGINLEWYSSSTTNVPYEFSFYDESGEKGKIVTTNMLLALCHKEKDFIIYCDRPTGINIGWDSVCKGGKQSTIQTFRNMVPMIKEGVKYGKWVLAVL